MNSNDDKHTYPYNAQTYEHKTDDYYRSEKRFKTYCATLIAGVVFCVERTSHRVRDNGKLERCKENIKRFCMDLIRSNASLYSKQKWNHKILDMLVFVFTCLQCVFNLFQQLNI